MLYRAAAGLLCLAATSAAAPATMEKLDLFEAGSGGYVTYRIPGVVVTAKGSVLAYAEARQSGRGDWGTIDIVLRRSTDGGRTWSAPRVIAEVSGPKTKNPVAVAQGLAPAGDVTYNNPVAIASRDGTVHFLFCLEYMRAFYMRSDDDGQTFRAPVEITQAFEGFRSEYAWKVLATGPGHGIEMRNGRLVVPVWLSTGTGGHAHRPSVASVIYSDDRGGTWRRGEIAFPQTSRIVNPSETVIAQLADGRVLLNARSESTAHRRLISLSRDGAAEWSAPEFHAELNEPICMAGMAAHGKLLLFSNPDNLERAAGPAAPGQPRDRRNLTVRLSRDGGRTFPWKRVLEPGPSGYSDLAVLPDGTVLCLYERGENAASRTAYLTLARFPLNWLKARER